VILSHILAKYVTLRALRRDDLPRLLTFNNDLAVELAGGGDPPPQGGVRRGASAVDSPFHARPTVPSTRREMQLGVASLTLHKIVVVYTHGARPGAR
jgi:hypothetical protein